MITIITTMSTENMSSHSLFVLSAMHNALHVICQRITLKQWLIMIIMFSPIQNVLSPELAPVDWPIFGSSVGASVVASSTGIRRTDVVIISQMIFTTEHSNFLQIKKHDHISPSSINHLLTNS